MDITQSHVVLTDLYGTARLLGGMDITRKTIVLAEDDPNDEELFRLALVRANLNCHVDVVRDGEELIHYLFGTGSHSERATKALPDLVLLDLKLPKFNGLQVLQILRNAMHGAGRVMMPVVVFTSSDDEKDLASSYGLGALGYVRKPVVHHRFIEVVQDTVLYWLAVNEPLPRGAARTATAPPENMGLQ